MREGGFQELRRGTEKVQKVTELNRGLEDLWNKKDSDAEEFQQYFGSVLPRDMLSRFDEGEGLVRYIQDELAPFCGKAIGLEIGGPGRNFFHDFEKAFFVRTIGVTLESGPASRTAAPDSHELLVADAFSSRGWSAVKKELGKDKPHFILERMLGALVDFPDSQDYWGAILGRWYGILAEGGMMLVESPSIDSADKAWELNRAKSYLANLASRREEYGIEVQSAERMHGLGDKRRILLRLKKLPGAVEKLPPIGTLIDPHQ